MIVSGSRPCLCGNPLHSTWRNFTNTSGGAPGRVEGREVPSTLYPDDMPSAMTASAVRRIRTALDEQRAALGEPPFAGNDEEAVHACAEAVVRAEQPLKPAVKAAVRGTLAVLSERAPGGSLEVRVPPYGAVQAIEGPRHTRGTPPGVVETDPLTWLRLVIGVADWTQEVSEHRVRAGGVRADLSAHLPLWERIRPE